MQWLVDIIEHDCQNTIGFTECFKRMRVQKGFAIEDIGQAINTSRATMYRHLDKGKWKTISEIDAIAAAMDCTDDERMLLETEFACDEIRRMLGESLS